MYRPLALLLATVPVLSVVAQVPGNDSCAFPEPLAIHDLLECPLLAVPGDNGQATWGGDLPACDGNGLSFPDVWYSFNSDVHSEVFLQLVPGTITDWGIEVMPDSCLATSFVCGVWPLFQFTIPTVPGTNYRIRVFTNTDFGSPGTFSLCLSAAMPQPLCDGGVVKTDQGDTTVTTCTDGMADPLTLVSYSQGSAPTTLILTDVNDTIITELPGGLLDADTLHTGTYRVHAVSWDGNLTGLAPGRSTNNLHSDGLCVELSDNHVSLYVELCTGMTDAQADPRTVRMDGEALLIGIGAAGPAAHVTVLDPLGRLLHRGRAPAGTDTRIALNGRARGTLLVRLDSEGRAPLVRRVLY